MSWLIYPVTAVHVIVCLMLILVVLLQSGKAADLAGAFGGMGSQTVFGPRGTATLLSKATTIAAALFMITSLSLGILANGQSRGSNSVIERRVRKAPTQKKSAPLPAPSQPVAPPPAATPGAPPAK
jgi:preprotein translocase subunit SecG